MCFTCLVDMFQIPGAHKLERCVKLSTLKFKDSETSAPGPRPSAPKGNNEFKILHVKIFSLNQKTNQILPATIAKIKFCLFKKTAFQPFVHLG